MSEIIDLLYCPISNKNIDIGLCQDIQMVADNAMKEEILEFVLSEIDKKMCVNCKKRIDPSI